METQAKDELLSQGFTRDNITYTSYINCRYQGTDTAMMTVVAKDINMSTNNSLNISKKCQNTFVENYMREFGFELVGRKVLVDDVRVRVVGKSKNKSNENNENKVSNENNNQSKGLPNSEIKILNPVSPLLKEKISVYFDGERVVTPVYMLANLLANQEIKGDCY